MSPRASFGLTLARAATTEHQRFVSGPSCFFLGCGHDFQQHSGACEVSKTVLCKWEQFLFVPARILYLDQQKLKGQFHVVADYSRSALSCGAHLCVRRGVAAPLNAR